MSRNYDVIQTPRGGEIIINYHDPYEEPIGPPEIEIVRAELATVRDMYESNRIALINLRKSNDSWDEKYRKLNESYKSVEKNRNELSAKVYSLQQTAEHLRKEYGSKIANQAMNHEHAISTAARRLRAYDNAWTIILRESSLELQPFYIRFQNLVSKLERQYLNGG